MHQTAKGKQWYVGMKAQNRNTSKIRSEVERAIGVIKRVFGFQKVR
jgi:hypothetical protein